MGKHLHNSCPANTIVLAHYTIAHNSRIICYRNDAALPLLCQTTSRRADTASHNASSLKHIYWSSQFSESYRGHHCANIEIATVGFRGVWIWIGVETSCVIAGWYALLSRHGATACCVKLWWRDGAMCYATVKQYNVLQCPYPDTVFIFENINTSSTHLFVLQWFAINLVLDWNIFHIG